MSTATAKTVNRDLSNLRKSVESMDAAEPERIGSPSIGDVVRQGDLYLLCIKNAAGQQLTKNRQLAPGETQGSRHIATGQCRITTGDTAKHVRALAPDVPSELVGPAIECLGEVTITHPEHGDKILPAGTNWAVVYQRAYAEEIRRVQD